MDKFTPKADHSFATTTSARIVDTLDFFNQFDDFYLVENWRPRRPRTATRQMDPRQEDRSSPADATTGSMDTDGDTHFSYSEELHRRDRGFALRCGPGRLERHV